MQLLRFPKTITIKLSDLERIALESILKQSDAYRDDEHLLHHVLGAGIAALLGGGADEPAEGDEVPSMAEMMVKRLKDMADQVDDSPELSAAGSLRPFPKVTRRYKDPRKEQVENYVGCPVDRRLQERLQLFLDTHPDQELEPLLAKLLAAGLDQAESNPAILNTEYRQIDELFPPVRASVRGRAIDEAFTLDFPRTIRLDLDDPLRDDLRALANLLPHEDDQQLVTMILERGIRAMKTDGVIPAHATSAGIKRARHKEHEKDLSLEERLRKKLTRFLSEHPDAMKRERARKLLADLGSGRE
jgi:hypothetical protein